MFRISRWVPIGCVVNMRVVLVVLGVLLAAVLQTVGVLHAHTHLGGDSAHHHVWVNDGDHFGHADGRLDADAVVPDAPSASPVVVLVIGLVGAVALGFVRDNHVGDGPGPHARWRNRAPFDPHAGSRQRLVGVVVQQV